MKRVLTSGSTDKAASFIFVYQQSSADYRSSLARPTLIGWGSKYRPIKFIAINQSTGFPLLINLMSQLVCTQI